MVPEAAPLTLNPAPVAVALEIVTLEFPVFVSAVLCELLLPTLTFPKFKLFGFAPSNKVEATPVPFKEIRNGEPGALLANETEPVTLPAVVGANSTLNVELVPAAIVVGTGRP